MKLTTIEKVYLKNFNTSHKTTDVKEILDKAYKVENDMRCTRPSDKAKLSDLLRELTLLSHHAGLLEKVTLETNSENTLALFVTTRENTVNGQRMSIRKDLISALNSSDLKMIGLYFCENGQDTMLNTYAVVLDVKPESDDHKQLMRAADKYNLDIRVTSRKWFDPQ